GRRTTTIYHSPFTIHGLQSFRPPPHTKSEETLVSSWMDLIAFARSGAMLKTSIFFRRHASSRSGIVLVVTMRSIPESVINSHALPDSTGCVKQAWTRSAPALWSAAATFVSDPPVSHM